MGDQSLKNIAAPVHAYRVQLSVGEGINNACIPSEALFRRPAVAVLPFENMSGDPDQEYFADGLTEDVITALSLWRSFPVIARNSTAAYKGQSPDIRKVGEELGARYIIEGSVRKSGNRVRVTAQLINSETGHHVWAERYDRDLADIFDLQDELSRHIAATVAPELEFSQVAGTKIKTPQNLNAWELVQRGYDRVFAADPESIKSAREYFQKAIELDSEYARAFVGMAWSYHREFWLDPAKFAGEGREQFIKAANRAVSFDEFDSEAHTILAMTWLWRGEPDRALLEIKRAVDLNPNNAVAQHVLGHTLTLLGQPVEGIANMERAIFLSPRDPRHGAWMWGVGLAHLTARQYEEAVLWSERAVQRLPGNPDGHLLLVSSLGHLGRTNEARAALDTYRGLEPNTPEQPTLVFRYKHEADEEHFLDGLRKAGWEG